MQGRAYEVRVFNTPAPEPNYVDAALIAVVQLHLRACEDSEEGDILVFLTGQEDIEDLESLLRERMRSAPPTALALDVVPLYASLPPHEQLRAFESRKPGTRKVVLATNIAETSVTIPGVRYVIDSGLAKVKCFKSATGVDSLRVMPISQAAALQRAGRAGREVPGECYRLYTEEAHAQLAPASTPELLRSSLGRVVLSLKAMGVKDFSAVDFVDRPDRALVANSLKELLDLGALSSRGELTSSGREMAVLPLEPAFARLLLKALDEEFTEVAASVVKIVALLSGESVFYSSRAAEKEAARARKRFVVAGSDHLTLLNVYERYFASGGEKKRRRFARENFLNEKTLIKAKKVRTQIAGYLARIVEDRRTRTRKDQDTGDAIHDAGEKEKIGIRTKREEKAHAGTSRLDAFSGDV